MMLVVRLHGILHARVLVVNDVRHGDVTASVSNLGVRYLGSDLVLGGMRIHGAVVAFVLVVTGLLLGRGICRVSRHLTVAIIPPRTTGRVGIYLPLLHGWL